MSIKQLLPDAAALLSLEPEELAGALLQYLNALPSYEQNKLNRYNFSLRHTVEEYPPDSQEEIRRALMEAWVWLEREGFLAPKPGSQGEWVFITRRGKQIATAADLEAYRKASFLPRQLLHARIAQKVWATFLRGDYDTAVFQAFKEVEVAVRNASGLPDTEIGAPLMRRAFQPSGGALTDNRAPIAEQEALAHLFAGAIGSYKNPHSHRSVTIGSAECVEMVVLASHLLGIIDRRQPVSLSNTPLQPASGA
jgi:uncharacterized protein (TIGR02391 family)